MGYFGGGDKKDAEFRKWVGSNYGPPGRISKSDLAELRKEYKAYMARQSGNAMSGNPGANAMSY